MRMLTLVLSVLTLTVLAATSAQAGVLTVVPASASSPAVPVYIARPEGKGPFPAIVLLHGCGGFNGFDAVAADRLAARGFLTVAVDALGAEHPAGVCGTTDEHSGQEASAARATLAWLRTQPDVVPDRLAVIGSSMGGNAVLKLVDPQKHGDSPPPGLRAAIAFYPYCEGSNGANVDVPLQIFIGDADKVTPSAPCSTLAAASKASGGKVDLTIYPGATHGFNIPGPDRTFFGEPIRYDADAANDAARRTLYALQAALLPAH